MLVFVVGLMVISLLSKPSGGRERERGGVEGEVGRETERGWRDGVPEFIYYN